MELSHSGIPLYYQLETILRKRIQSGEFKAGSLLPTADDLSHEYGVSRITVRQALSNLVRDGLVLAHRGKGTFVAQRPVGFDPPRLSGFLEDLIDIGVRTESKILAYSKSPVGKRVADYLGVVEGTELLRIERLRLVAGSPFVYVLEYVPLGLGNRIDQEDLSVKPLLSILEDKLGVRPFEANQSIEADSADGHVAPLLGVRVGDPVLKIERTAFDSERKPIMHGSMQYRADKYRFFVHLERRYSAKSARWAPVGSTNVDGYRKQTIPAQIP